MTCSKHCKSLCSLKERCKKCVIYRFRTTLFSLLIRLICHIDRWSKIRISGAGHSKHIIVPWLIARPSPHLGDLPLIAYLYSHSADGCPCLMTDWSSFVPAADAMQQHYSWLEVVAVKAAMPQWAVTFHSFESPVPYSGSKVLSPI